MDIKKFYRQNQNILIFVLCIVVLLFGVYILSRQLKIGKENAVIINKDSSEEKHIDELEITVDVQGAVKKPGIYKFEEGALVDDAIEAAGGMVMEADIDYVASNINRAEKLKDAQKIFIPEKSDSVMDDDSSPNTTDVVSSDSSLSGKININTASLEQLDSLPGIGPSYAQRIVDGRLYSKIEDIKNIKGIGDATFDKIKDLISI